MASGSAGLKTHIWNNNLRSLVLLALYPLLVIAVVWIISFLSVYFMSESFSSEGGPARTYAAGQAFLFVRSYWPFIVSAVGVWFLFAFFMNTRMIRALSRSHPVTREEEPELYNMLENLCISRGMSTPRLEIIETHARNAFASGIDRKSYTVTVTRGLLQSLEKDEIEAVLAHELTHIIHGDVRLLIVSVIFTGLFGFFAQLLWNGLRFHVYAGRGSRKSGRLMLLLFMVIAVLWLGYIATLMTRFALSRSREYMADAGAVEMTKNPDAMMRALLRIAKKDKIPETTDDIALMCIENSRKFMGLFSTHPPLDYRLNAISGTTATPIPDLDPGFRAEDSKRFKSPEGRRYPWLTAQRRRRSPWAE